MRRDSTTLVAILPKIWAENPHLWAVMPTYSISAHSRSISRKVILELAMLVLISIKLPADNLVSLGLAATEQGVFHTLTITSHLIL